MGDIDNELATAARHVAKARRLVARPRVRIVKLKARGMATLDREVTLAAFVSTLALLESHAPELADTAKKFGSPPRKLSQVFGVGKAWPVYFCPATTLHSRATAFAWAGALKRLSELEPATVNQIAAAALTA